MTVCPRHKFNHICIEISHLRDEIYDRAGADRLLGATLVNEIMLLGKDMVRRDPTLKFKIVDSRMPHKLQREDLMKGIIASCPRLTE